MPENTPDTHHQRRNILRMPGFTAETSLNQTGRYFHTMENTANYGMRVIPQRAVSSCIQTSEGGQWCCFPGKNGRPVCIMFPPVPVVLV